MPKALPETMPLPPPRRDASPYLAILAVVDNKVMRGYTPAECTECGEGLEI